ncbi:MAG: hypothetical protein U0821_25425 [Chloroflexota bacterium]
MLVNRQEGGPSRRGAATVHEALLVYDTQTQHLPKGVRAAAQRTRRLLFAGGGMELALQLSADPASTGAKMVAQVLLQGTPAPDIEVFLDGRGGSHEQVTDAEGELRLARLATGQYTAWVRTPRGVVRCGPISVGEEDSAI